ncbi:CHAT domain-containing protein [Bizionia algoritergicola]|uniref:CHAT domain-containing protein n=1 Tax=Bizionia algoritergicola TaxID=291187 RepID=UPI0009F1E493|nr:CHAT domain-containing protein [Bizionia algoritergicola]
MFQHLQNFKNKQQLPLPKFWVFAMFLMFQIHVHAQSLEDAIYSATETFIANKNQQSFQVLNTEETTFKNQISTKDEGLAYVFLLCNKAYYLNENNQLQDAISNYEAARTRYNKNQLYTISDYDITEYCLKPLGNLYTKTNNYTNAENTIKQYVALAGKSKNSTHYISGIINLSVLYQTRGMHQSVLNLIKKTAGIPNISQTQKNKLNTLKASSSIAINNSSNYNLDIDVIFSNQDGQYNTNRLAYELALKKGDYKVALKHLNLSTVYRQKDPLTFRELAKNRLEKGQLHYLLNDFDKANQQLQVALHTLLPNLERKAIPINATLYAENTFIDIFDLLARLQSDPEKALQYYDLSFYVSRLLTTNVTSQESKIANQSANRKRSENCMELLYKIYQKSSDLAVFERALQYSEMQKASVLKDMFQKKTLLEEHPTDSLLLKEQELLQEQEQLTAVMIKKQLGYQTIKNDSLNTQLLDISVQLKKLQKTISDRYPQIENRVYSSEIHKHLERDKANLILYFYGQRAVYHFIFSEENTAFIKTPITNTYTNDITEFIHLFDDPSVINNNMEAFTNQAHGLYKQLNLSEVSPTKNLIIIPDGILNFIPFEALLTEQTETNSFKDMPFIVSRQAVVYNSSLAFYLQPKKPSKNRNLLGIFPVFENTNQPLTYSIQEAEAIKKETNASLYMHQQATKQRFIDDASKYSILHLSTHASGGDFINPARLAFSDEPMLLNELYSLNIHPDLVVLSACETGIGKLEKGEGAMSIARGFQYAGAKNVLYSLWQINDASTATLMSFFYKSLQETNSVFTANRQSKLNYLNDDTISNIKKSPYYWSAFVYYGNLVPPSEKDQIVYYIIGILAFFIIVFLVIRKRKTNERKISN